jgi:hypothetical protein
MNSVHAKVPHSPVSAIILGPSNLATSSAFSRRPSVHASFPMNAQDQAVRSSIPEGCVIPRRQLLLSHSPSPSGVEFGIIHAVPWMQLLRHGLRPLIAVFRRGDSSPAHMTHGRGVFSASSQQSEGIRTPAQSVSRGAEQVRVGFRPSRCDDPLCRLQNFSRQSGKFGHDLSSTAEEIDSRLDHIFGVDQVRPCGVEQRADRQHMPCSTATNEFRLLALLGVRCSRRSRQRVGVTSRPEKLSRQGTRGLAMADHLDTVHEDSSHSARF